jgi:hypothetical protein
MLPTRRLLSMHTQNVYGPVRIADTPPIGAVVTPDWFVETAHGLGLYPTKGYCLRLYASSLLSMPNMVIYF